MKNSEGEIIKRKNSIHSSFKMVLSLNILLRDKNQKLQQKFPFFLSLELIESSSIRGKISETCYRRLRQCFSQMFSLFDKKCCVQSLAVMLCLLPWEQHSSVQMFPQMKEQKAEMRMLLLGKKRCRQNDEGMLADVHQ